METFLVAVEVGAVALKRGTVRRRSIFSNPASLRRTAHSSNADPLRVSARGGGKKDGGGTYSGGRRRASGRATVPVGDGVTEALADSDSLVAERGERLEHVLGEGVRGRLVDVVGDAEPVTASSLGTTSSDVALEPFLGVLDLGVAELVVVVRVNVEIGNVVSKVGHGLLAARSSGAAGVRRAHVGREEADDVTHSHLELPHLVPPLHLGNGTQVQMGPCVGCELVTLGVHALDGGHVSRGRVDLTLVDVGTGDEEGSLAAILLEEVQDVISVVLDWAVVEGESDGAGLLARVDTSPSICHRADLGTGNGRGVGSGRSLVLGAGRAELVLAAGRVAVIARVAAPYSLLACII